MESRIPKALELHRKGYNCAQAIVCAYCDLFGMDEETAYRASEAFGFGMGQMEICGALSGACMLAGMKNSGAWHSRGRPRRQHIRSTGSCLRHSVRKTKASCAVN